MHKKGIILFSGLKKKIQYFYFFYFIYFFFLIVKMVANYAKIGRLGKLKAGFQQVPLV